MSDMSVTGMMGLILAVMLVWAGVNILLALRKLNQTYELESNRFIYPANCKPELCKDPAGFVAFMTPRLTVFAVLILALSVVLVLQMLTGLLSSLPDWVARLGPMLLFIPLFIWYIVFINKAAKRFW